MTHFAGVGTQVEKLGKATLVLMSLTLSPEKRMAGAMMELEAAFLENPPYGDESAAHLGRLRSLFDGEDSWQERAERLSPSAREQAFEAFWRLHQSVMHAVK
jgi:hypothetical protein